MADQEWVQVKHPDGSGAVCVIPKRVYEANKDQYEKASSSRSEESVRPRRGRRSDEEASE